MNALSLELRNDELCMQLLFAALRKRQFTDIQDARDAFEVVMDDVIAQLNRMGYQDLDKFANWAWELFEQVVGFAIQRPAQFAPGTP